MTKKAQVFFLILLKEKKLIYNESERNKSELEPEMFGLKLHFRW